MKNFIIYLCALAWISFGNAWAWYPQRLEQSLLPQTDYPALMGEHRAYKIGVGETLIEIARQAGLGYLALCRANPDTDPWLPPAGDKIILPYAFLLPTDIKPGITINLAEFRLYYVWQEQNRLRVRVYPVGIGSSGWDTPQGEFEITEKIVHPVWYAPASIRKENPRLAARIPAGPDNPLGEYWLGLSARGYGIHGTSKPYGVGRRISHGCLRLYPADIRDLFARVKPGTTVRIIRQPVKTGLKDGKLLLEVHRPDDADTDSLLLAFKQQVTQLPWQGVINMQTVEKEIAHGRGIATIVSDD
ncbi:L,D-transpeptidase family protein [Syntrophotalea carbinolica]|nr:L,D-transpeptidase family protein [Syntrophotalea carbinolica]